MIMKHIYQASFSSTSMVQRQNRNRNTEESHTKACEHDWSLQVCMYAQAHTHKICVHDEYM